MWNQNIIINFAQNHRLMIMSNNNDYVRNLTDYIDHFITMASDDKPNDDFFRSAGLQGIKAEDIINQLRNSFHHD